MNYFVNNDRGKNQYEYLGDVRTRTNLRPVFSLIIVCTSIILLTLSVWNLNNIFNPTSNSCAFYLNSEEPLLHGVSKKFLSFGLDASLLRDMTNFPITNKKFIKLAGYLAPAYVRIGGTSADCLHFNQTAEKTSENIISPVDRQDISNFTITDVDFENIYNFAKRSQLRMIFDLNVLIRNVNGTWDSTNAQDIISFAKEHGMELDWQLGNEPNSFNFVFNVNVTPMQLGNDYYHLRQLLNEKGYSNSILVGPEVNHVGETSRKGELYAKTVLEHCSGSINFLTWHQYYLNGRVAKVEDFVNPAVFNRLPMEIKSMGDTIKSYNKNLHMWLSETSTAYGGGAPELSDRFVAGFLWLDKLGYSAKAGVNVVTRQSFFGENYAMIGSDLTPNPDWWVSVIYKEFVSEKVLKLMPDDNCDYARLYAHCTPAKALINRVPAITIYGMNLDKESVRVKIQGLFPIIQRDSKIFLYTLTSFYLQSREIMMNGEVLRLQKNLDLPPFKPVILDVTQTIYLPPYSMVFMVVHGANMNACMT